MRVLCFTLAVFGMVVALPVPTTKTDRLKQILSEPYSPNRNAALENLILGLIEELRETMLNGSDDIPVLDPLEIDHILIDDEILPFPGSKVTINDLNVKKLATFEVNDLTVRRTSLILQRYRIQLDGEVPVIDVDVGNYDVLVNAMGFNIFGNGDAKIKVIQPRIKVDLLVAPRISISGIFLNLLECDIKFSLRDFQPNITGMFHDNAVSAFVSLFLQNLVGDLLELYEDDINKFLSTTIHEAANEILKDLNLISILG
ncbi:uncharacterized protein LOC115448813 [Manduca sexta]|uniref:uncharacterized protein LOC115448813 n=1 Tax=Manduca sexta TaxID=7130 RepID=UPI00188DD9E4|nr:uncharacterized protein LOC115448813 [Manduca sexta]